MNESTESLPITNIRPRVSAVITTYNCEKYLLRAIRSVLDQTYGPIELIVVDDASTDNSRELVQNLQDRRITYVRHDTNQGGSAARNTGIGLCKSEYIAFLDSDDEWFPQKIEKQMDLFLRLGPAFGLVYTGFNIVDDEDHFIKSYIRCERRSLLNSLLLTNIVATTSTVMVRRNFIEKIGGFDTQMKSCQDWDLYIRLSKACLFDCVNEALVKYRRLKTPQRISNNRLSGIQGHRRIQEKFREELRALPKSLLLKHLVYFSHVYLGLGALGLSLKMLGRAFHISWNPFYILMMVKRLLTFFIIKNNDEAFQT